MIPSLRYFTSPLRFGNLASYIISFQLVGQILFDIIINHICNAFLCFWLLIFSCFGCFISQLQNYIVQSTSTLFSNFLFISSLINHQPDKIICVPYTYEHLKLSLYFHDRFLYFKHLVNIFILLKVSPCLLVEWSLEVKVQRRGFELLDAIIRTNFSVIISRIVFLVGYYTSNFMHVPILHIS